MLAHDFNQTRNHIKEKAFDLLDQLKYNDHPNDFMVKASEATSQLIQSRAMLTDYGIHKVNKSFHGHTEIIPSIVEALNIKERPTSRDLTLLTLNLLVCEHCDETERAKIRNAPAPSPSRLPLPTEILGRCTR